MATQSDKNRLAMKVTLCGMVLGAAVSLSLPRASAQDQPDPVREYVDAQLQWRLIPGLSLAVARGGRLIREEVFGVANRESGDSVRVSTVFQLGSVGKQFTAAAIMLLAEDGRIRLDDSVRAYIHGAPASWKRVTVRHLLTHTSGLGNYVSAVPDLSKEFTSPELVALIASQPLEFAPGAKFRYSNSGYLLLGLVVEAISGEHLADFLSRRFFTPLGMAATGVTGRTDWPALGAAGYRIVDGIPVRAPAVSRSLNSTGDGTVYSTLADLLKWDAALYGDHPLSRANRAAMWSPARLSDGTLSQYGFGWGLANVHGHRVVEHGGQWQGFAAHLARYLDDSITVVVLMNATGLGNISGQIANRVAQYYIPPLRDEAWPRPASMAVDTATLDSYTGEFRIVNSTIRIWREGSQLLVSTTGRGTARLVPISPTEFTILVDRVRFRFSAQRGRKPDLYVRGAKEQMATRLR